MTHALRVAFALLAALVVAAQAGRIAVYRGGASRDGVAGADPSSATAAARLDRLALRPLPPAEADPVPPGAILAMTQGCDAPLLLAALQFDGAGSDTAQALLARPGLPRFVYLGAVRRDANQAALLARWAAASAARAIGLRRTPVPREMVLVMLPDSCPGLAARDWSALSPWSES